MFCDSHSHFDAFCAEGMLAAVIERARAAGVDRIVAVGGAPAMNAAAIAAGREFPANVWVAIGLDRDQAEGRGADERAERLGEEIERLRADSPVVRAVGEIGLDFHYHPETADVQMALFQAQLALAARLGLPVIVHSRMADRQTLDVLGRHHAAWTGDAGRVGVLHCFTGDCEFAGRLLDLGFHLGFSGIVTFRNADALRAVARDIPEDRLLIETDAPYLAPVPHRGQRNEPAFVRHVAERLAQVRGCSTERVAELTRRNAQRLFGGDSG